MSSDHEREEREPSSEREPVVITDKRRVDRDGVTRPVPADPAAGLAAEAGQVPMVEASMLEERTADLQRLHAEYANYRKRAERDRLAAGEAAIGRVLAEFLPVLDNLDRAEAHGDLTGGLKAISDQLNQTFDKLGLERFGEVGDPFDPAIHEAVLHDESAEVDVPTCTTVMRPGYRHNGRLLRAAMVGVSDPAPAADPQSDHEPDEDESDDA